MTSRMALSSLTAWLPRSGATPARSATPQPSATPDPAAQERVNRAKTALEAMKQATEAQRNDSKAMAQLRLEWIKEQIRILRQFGGDPKAVARQVTQLARELGSAVREYTAAARGGQAGDVAAATQAAPNEAVSNEAAATQATSADPATAATEGTATVAATADKAGEERAETDKAAVHHRETSGLPAEDQPFFDLARSLLKALKDLIAAQQDRARRGDRDAQEAVTAVRDATKAIDDALVALQPGVNLQV